MVKRGERIKIVESFEGGNKKKKERLFNGYKGGTKNGKKDGERLERKKKERKRKKEDCQMVRNEETKKGCPRKDIP